MREVHELEVYQLAEALSDRIWYAFDAWPLKAQWTIGYQIIDKLGPKLNAFIRSTK